MSARIEPIAMGMSTSYLVVDDGVILVDAGSPRKAKRLRRALERLSIRPEEIALVLVTHGHWDHIGSARAVRELTGARIAMSRREAAWLETGRTEFPPGLTAWGKVYGLPMKVAGPLARVPACEVDSPLDDTDLRLDDYGVRGTVVHTPGHTAGSMTLLLDSGDAVVGDLAMNGFPLRRGPGLPTFGDDAREVERSWRVLLERGARRIHPAHGASFDASVLAQAVQ